MRRITGVALVGTLAVACAISGTAPPATAESGDLVTLPSANLRKTTSTLSGLSLSVDSRWIDNYGYRPLRVQVKAPAPVTTERLVTIKVHLDGWDALRWREMVVEQDLILPIGATSASTTVAVPTYQTWNQLWWTVWVDGFEDEELSLPSSAAVQIVMHGQNAGRGWQPEIWMLDFELPGFGDWIAAPLLAPSIGLAPPLPKQARPVWNERLGIETYRITDAPTRWIDYSCIDIIAVTPQELVQLARLNPDALIAVRLWIQSGGMLWVDNVGSAWNKLDTVEEVLNLPSGNGEAANESDGPTSVPHSWLGSAELEQVALGPTVTFVDLTTGELQTVREERRIASLMISPQFVPLDSDLSPEEATARLRQAEKWYIQRPLGFGSVRAYRGEWIHTPIDAAMLFVDRWVTRHGLAPNASAGEFNNWLVPDVGLAPVTIFRILITLFVLVIGPLNFLILQKSGRLHLLVLTVPTAAALVAGGLFLYAVLADGLSTRLRVRSVTLLDESTGDAASWARLSYYSGLAPSGGLAMEADAVCYPILPGWYESFGELRSRTRQEIFWTDGAQRLTSGWLQSRTPTQYLAITAQPSQRRLEVRRDPDSLRVRNRIGTSIQLILALDEGLQAFEGQNLGNGATATLNPISRTDAARQLRQLIAENAPEFPSGYAGVLSDYAREGRRRSRRTWSQFGVAYSGETLGQNRLSRFIEQLPEAFGDQPGLLRAPFYVVVTKTAPEVTAGVPEVTEDASFNVLVGSW